MGNTEKENPSNSEKSSPPAGVGAKDQNNIHPYPDWASIQAFYGPHLAVPPYLNSAVASPHAPPPYIWAPPRSMIAPYGSPYAAFYANGGVYPHVGVPLAGTSLSIEKPVKSSGNTDGGLVKKLKEFNGLAISVGNGKCDSTDHGTDHKLSDSDETEGSSDGSNRVTARTDQSCKKRSRHGSPNKGDHKGQKESISMPDQTSDKMIDKVPPANTKEENTDSTALELKNPALNLQSSPTSGLQPSLPNEDWLMNERELKRERRKQSNRESARRSRLRKQAEAEELAIKVKALTTENLTLTSEIKILRESVEKLRLENTALMDKIRDGQVVHREEVNLHKIDNSRPKPVGTVNLLERVNNSDSTGKTNEDGESYENRSSGVRLRQLLDPSPRTDAVAAG